MEGDRLDPPVNGGLRDAAPGLLRLAGGAFVRTAQWTADAGVRAASRVAQAATSGESAAELIGDVRGGAREQARRFLGLGDVVEPQPADDGRHSLRERGAELLDRSADVAIEEDAHPAYERILDELAPDEARILRLLAVEGAEPAVDVRTASPLGVGSELVAPGLTMIGARAGCRHTERVPAYLNNLYRLGLVWFSREPVSDPLRYQVLEAQPEVTAAVRGARRGKTVRRSIHLTPFGEDFCATCLPLSGAPRPSR